jgi:putative sigma-54 modulation protein
MTINATTREYIDKKVNRLRRLVPKIDEMSFTLGKEKLLIDVEGKFKAGKIAAQASTKAEHLNEAIDMLVDKLEAQITKFKKKLSDRSPAARQAALAEERELAPDTDLAEEIAEEIDETLRERRAAEG